MTSRRLSSVHAAGVFVLACISVAAACTRVASELAGGCADAEKACDGKCVRIDDAAFGCTPTSCSPCQVDSATPACHGSQCAVGNCLDGFGDCDALDDNGCEVDLASDTDNCGGCRKGCELPQVQNPTCSGGSCGVADCEESWADCNGTAGDGCEVQPHGSAANCGACGRDCLGGGCTAGKCDPVVMLSTSSAVSGVAVDDAYVYFATLGDSTTMEPAKIRRIAKSAKHGDAQPEEVAVVGLPVGLAVLGDDVVYADLPAGVFRVAKGGGGTPDAVALGPYKDPWGVATNPRTGAIYWANYTDVVDVSGVWKLEGAGVYGYDVCSLPPCLGRPALALHDDTLFWVVGGAGLGAGVFGAHESDATASEFIQSFNQVFFVAADDHYVYWTTQLIVWFRERSAAANPEELTGVNGYGGIAVDDTNVYFGEAEGMTLKRMRKPLPP